MRWRNGVAAFMGLAALAFSPAYGAFEGRWYEENTDISLVITPVSGSYVAVYQNARMRSVTVSGNSVKIEGSYDCSGSADDDFRCDVVLDLVLSDDGGVLMGAKHDDTHWTNSSGERLHAPSSRQVMYTRRY